MDRPIRALGERVTLPGEVPLFPLPDHVLLPGIPAPYRVFEPRYRTLVQDLLDQPEDERWLCVPRLAPGWKADYHGRPPFHAVATLGRILTCEPLAGGHYFILVTGEIPVRLVECASDRPYRLACVEALPDDTMASHPRLVRDAIDELVQAVYTLSQIVGTSASDLTDAIAEQSDMEQLIYRLAAGAMDEPDERQRLLEERCLIGRAELVLDSLTGLIALSSCHLGSVATA